MTRDQLTTKRRELRVMLGKYVDANDETTIRKIIRALNMINRQLEGV